MGIFDSLIFESFDFLLEGDQAIAYKKRKAEEKAAAKKTEEERSSRRSFVGDKYGSQHPTNDRDAENFKPEAFGKQASDADRRHKAYSKMLRDLENNPNSNITSDLGSVASDVNRHYRRHPKNESTF